jgi:exodeoxyribonuclease-1
MNQLYWDIETLDKDVFYSGILSASFQLVNDSFQTLERFDVDCNFKPGVVPSPKALLVNNQSIQSIKGRNRSHFQMVREIYNKMQEWGTFQSCTYNGISFDEEFLRSAFYSSLLPIYTTNTKGNKRFDVLNLARATSIYAPGKIKYKINEKGKPSFTLEDISKANRIISEGFHEAAADVEATIGVSKLIKQKCPELWNSYDARVGKLEAKQFVENEKFFCHAPISVLKCLAFVGTHKIFSYPICFDLQYDPNPLVNALSDYNLFKEELEKGKNKKTNALKIISNIKCNKSIVLMESEHALKSDVYKSIGMKQLMERANIISKNRKKLAERINEYHEENFKEEDLSQVTPEKLIYKGSFASKKDEELMANFHKMDSWDKRIEFIGKFESDRFNYFCRKIIYEESPLSLPKRDYEEVHMGIAKRIFSKEKENFMTIKEAQHVLDEQRGIADEKGDQNTLDFLNEIDLYIKDMIKNYETN